MDHGKGERVYRFCLILVPAFVFCPGRKGINYFSVDSLLGHCIILQLQIRSDENLSGQFSSRAYTC